MIFINDAANLSELYSKIDALVSDLKLKYHE